MTTGALPHAPSFRQPPEWEPWLAFVEETLREAASPRWEVAAPELFERRPALAPLLAGANVTLPEGALVALLRRFVSALGRPSMETLSGVERVLENDEDLLALLGASLADEAAIIESLADRRGVDAAALEAISSLLPVPLLQACRRRLADRIDPGWNHGYCPLCGSWPALAEMLAEDRSRWFRCGRCGAAWPALLLACAFCRTRDHAHYVSLIPGDGQPAVPQPGRGEDFPGNRRIVEACTRCSGYVKTFNTLQPGAPLDVMRLDLASIDLDLAALESGYARPARTGYPLGLHLRGVAPLAAF